MRGLLNIRAFGALLACAGGLATVAAAPAVAASYSPYNETAAAALSRYVRALADEPRDFQTLVSAGRAALELGDTQSAAGFFARADEVNPRSPLPQAGMAAVQVANGDARAAMPYFARAQQLGATAAMLGSDRGLAHDLLGQQAQAQADYKAALAGPDADEARRRLALSLAISGDKNGALATLTPLIARRDATAARVSAFVLALAGDPKAAMSAINSAMPGSSASVAPFLQRLPALSAGQKAAAVNLGIFPDSSGVGYAYSPPVQQTVAVAQNPTGDRLAGIEALINSPAPAPAAQQAQAQPREAVYRATSAPAPVRALAPAARKIWLQLASGSNQSALSSQFKRLQSRNRDLFEGINGYVAEAGDRARLVVGPFRGPSDAAIFEEDLRTVGIDAFRWTSSASDRIVPLATQ